MDEVNAVKDILRDALTRIDHYEYLILIRLVTLSIYIWIKGRLFSMLWIGSCCFSNRLIKRLINRLINDQTFLIPNTHTLHLPLFVIKGKTKWEISYRAI